MNRIWIVLLAAALVAVTALPAPAQMGGKHRGGEKAGGPKKPSVDDKAYQAALKSIPEPKGPVDPWGQVRPADPKKK